MRREFDLIAVFNFFVAVWFFAFNCGTDFIRENDKFVEELKEFQSEEDDEKEKELEEVKGKGDLEDTSTNEVVEIVEMDEDKNESL